MYDMKLPEIPAQHKTTEQENSLNEHITAHYLPRLGTAYSSCSIIKLPIQTAIEDLYRHQSVPTSAADSTHMSLLKLRRRRWLVQRHACLLSILLAFIFGMALGILLPMFGWSQVLPTISYAPSMHTAAEIVPPNVTFIQLSPLPVNQSLNKVIKARPPSDFPTIYELQAAEQTHTAFSVAFIKEKLEPQLLQKPVIKKLPVVFNNSVPLNAKFTKTVGGQIINANIYWGAEVEQMLPRGFTPEESLSWNKYLRTQAVVTRLEIGCGRMQNRLVIFSDGTRACARYRQNTDQIQGELFSFYLAQLLNLTNLAPSAAAVVNLNSTTWHSALADITQAQWKQQRPVVLTQWLPDLEPAGIPLAFQPMERHLNKYDVLNMTLSLSRNDSTTTNSPKQSHNQLHNQLLQESSHFRKRLGSDYKSTSESADVAASLKRQLIELAQWSDLIVFDYLIANLDRVVNNLYNFQWNADIMAAPAHNLARQTHSQLLVFLDNESGLLHGYRLLKKYESYHSLLLDNLCVFRQPTIEALKALQAQGVGKRMRDVFEATTTTEVRDVLPSLPDKSIKILVDRIDRVLGQVQKCSDLLIDR